MSTVPYARGQESEMQTEKKYLTKSELLEIKLNFFYKFCDIIVMLAA